ncbi:MAG: T9SS type A sorting domain-containing protein [Chitinophagales bacterium]|nr:T9SS type A sorting domain-containing protein [Chitinophagales bacterium]
MKKSAYRALLIFWVFLYCNVLAQEQLIPLGYNVLLFDVKEQSHTRSALSLPFLDDFSYEGVLPNPEWWINSGAFVNTTFAVDPISIGVATLDGLNGNGIPYDTLSFNFGSIGAADTLSSMAILLAALSPADSVYFSFFFQPGGLGDEPNPESFNVSNYGVAFGDSLVLEFKDIVGSWHHIWSHDGAPMQAFEQVLVPVIDTAFFHDDFQFRFRNYASLIGNYDSWHLDYIKMNSGRNINDTLITDVAIQSYPSSILKNYEAMPWRQFQDFQTTEKASEHFLTIKNNFNVIKNTSYYFESFEAVTSTPIFTSPVQGQNIDANDTATLAFPDFEIPAFNNDSVVITTRYIIGATGDNNTRNDTVDRDQVFSNYLAYDDGSAEATYRLLGSPASLALEFHVNQPDTLRGIAIHYATTDEDISQNLFSLVVWSALNDEDTLYRDDFLKPLYSNTINGFVLYRFGRPVVVTDTFFIGWQQTSLASDVKIDVGYDLNDNASDHLFYNINDGWFPSSFTGAVMMRAVLGEAIPFGVGVQDPVGEKNALVIYPNPVYDKLNIQYAGDEKYEFKILDYSGRTVLSPLQTTTIPVVTLPSGLYFLKATNQESGLSSIHKFIKQ